MSPFFFDRHLLLLTWSPHIERRLPALLRKLSQSRRREFYKLTDRGGAEEEAWQDLVQLRTRSLAELYLMNIAQRGAPVGENPNFCHLILYPTYRKFQGIQEISSISASLLMAALGLV